ncbi:hypothetical protein BDP27DRAFT_1233249 [Rhodocollybia butyracea]|uniref:EthD domain-containing protein n=1 Tax=Rhodocollybia butyracea TaxID=206335 RepID=A0A9P5PF04_9AGAR|nr:hypothetical protein BDP27DRAFT_1233249 [Rhodocollybia butyracea]
MSPSRVRLLIAVHKNEDISTEQFRDYWQNTHSKIFLGASIVKRNILRYEQMYVNEEIRSLVRTLGFRAMDCDGLVMYEAESFAKIADVFLDTEFIRDVITSEMRFVDRDRAQVIPVDFISFLDLP